MALKTLFFLLFCMVSQAKMIKIAILDTGYYIKESKFKECVGLERNFTNDKSMEDTYPHGQNIVNIITKDLEKIDYCVINIKIMTRDEEFNSYKYGLALEYMLTLHPDIVNMSFVGGEENNNETKLIKKGLDAGIIFVTVAGNSHKKLTNKECKVFPACADSRVKVVGSLKSKYKRSNFSGYGNRVNYWEYGENVMAGGITMSGTSQAAAKRTNRIVKELAK